MVRKLKIIIKGLINPKENKNCLLFIFLKDEEITAICPLPMAGRKPKTEEKNVEKIPDESNSFFVIFIFFIDGIFCSGILVFCFIEIIKEEAPNNPVNNGSRGSFNSMFKVINPKIPARTKTRRAENILFFSW